MPRQLSHMFKQHLAAYAASQPLLDAIIIGKRSTAKQAEKLARASEIVRTVHVQVPSATGPQAAEDHNKSLDSIVAAWKNATEAYTEIFNSLADLTAANPSLGREATRGHEDFRKMAESAARANTVASEWVSAAETSSPGVNPGSTRNSVDLEDKMDVDEHFDESAGDGVSPTAAAITSTTEKAAKKKEELEQKRAKKRASHREKIADLKAKKSELPQPKVNGAVDDDMGNSGGVKLPHVEYEDVSAEVEARLKAKEEKKKAKKAEKKRKRGSADSVALLEAVDHADKPRSKKARPSAAASEQDAAESAAGGKVSKRKSHNGDGEVGEARKKRKRTK